MSLLVSYLSNKELSRLTILTYKTNYTINSGTQHVSRNTERSQCIMLERIRHFSVKDKRIDHDHNSRKTCKPSCQNQR